MRPCSNQYSCFCEQEQSMEVDKASHLKLDTYPHWMVVHVCLLQMQYFFSIWSGTYHYNVAHVGVWKKHGRLVPFHLGQVTV